MSRKRPEKTDKTQFCGLTTTFVEYSGRKYKTWGIFVAKVRRLVRFADESLKADAVGFGGFKCPEGMKIDLFVDPTARVVDAIGEYLR